MRYRELFSLYRRKMKNGKAVWYYQCYDDNGVRQCGHSTGKTTKTEARNYCIQLVKEDRLITKKGRKVPTFGEFARDFWDFQTSEYLSYVKTRRPITQSYADSAKKLIERHALGTFKNIPLDKITETHIDNWLVSLSSQGLRAISANVVFAVMKIMLNWAVKKRLIKHNPGSGVKKLAYKTKQREIFSHQEIQKLFGNDGEIWKDQLYCKMCKLAACTGMRVSEVIGLRGCFAFENYITVAGQYSHKYGFTETKNHKIRNITIPMAVSRELQKLKEISGDRYLFSKDGGITPVKYSALNRSFLAAIKKIGIGDDERKRRGLTFHSWRHFFNTSLRLANVADSKVRFVIGHTGESMTEHYTHFDARQFYDIREVQERLLSGV